MIENSDREQHDGAPSEPMASSGPQPPPKDAPSKTASPIDVESDSSSQPPPPSAPPPSASIPRAISTKRLALYAAVGLLFLYVGALIGPFVKADAAKVKAAITGSHDEHGESSGDTHYYTCGMHPWVIMPRPGTCPICGMDLVPLDPAKFSGEVTIDPVVSQNIGVRVEEVGQGTHSGAIRTVGTVTYDETLLGDVNLKVSGWIENLHVDYLGAPVKRGQPLFELYSPELFAAQEEYLLAYRASQRAQANASASASNFASRLLDPARTKLSFYDIGSKQIESLQARDAPVKTMTITAPQSGVVIEKHVFEGMKVTPGMTAYRIADLSRVWVMATLYEYQSRQIEVGLKAKMTLTYLPGEELQGKVVYIYPFLDEKTRQINVRLEFANPGLKLKPGMYSTILFEGTRTETRVLVSRSAVIDTGERQVAFVARGQGRFEPRAVKMGAETEDGKVEIIDGLKPGERVVVSGQFLIDSEARMREALAKMMRGTPAAEATAPKAPEVGGPTASLQKGANKALSHAIDGYLAIGESLASDTTTNIGVSARKLNEAVDALTAMPIPDNPHFWHEHQEAKVVKESALALASAPSVAAARETFAALSTAFSQLLHATGVPGNYDKKLQDAHCPMYPAGSKEGSVWVQASGEVRNPYFGEAMLSCSDWQRPLEAAR